MQETVKMQGEYQSGTASITPTAATFGDALTIVSASIPGTPVVSNFSGLQLLCDNSAYSLSNTASLIPYKSVITPAAAAATEITSSSQALRTCMTSRQPDFINCHALCLPHPHNATKEVSSLRKENSKLCSINNRLSLIVQSYINDPSVPVGGDETKNRAAAVAAVTAFDLANRHGRLCISENEVEKEGNSNESPTRSMEGSDVDRMALPKSISVRSNEPWKGVTGQNPGEGNPPVAVVKGRSKKGCSSGTGKQKVYLRGGKKEEARVMLEVYNQGMFKTELCNKWQETGTCPYRDHCQFAHGIKELRPVIRHPRYKTEVCRLVLSGDVCPYGHRCHFRHSLTEQEKLASMTPLKTAEEID